VEKPLRYTVKYPQAEQRKLTGKVLNVVSSRPRISQITNVEPLASSIAISTAAEAGGIIKINYEAHTTKILLYSLRCRTFATPTSSFESDSLQVRLLHHRK